MATGQLDFVQPNKRFSRTFLFMERSITQFLQILFSTFEPSKSYYHYDDDPEITEIAIEGRRTDNLETVDTRPKIVVYRGPVAWNNHNIGALAGSRNLSQAQQSFTDINSGTVSINCFSSNDQEADVLANICFDAIKQFRQVIQKFGFLSIRSAQAGQRALVKRNGAKDELFVVPVIIEVQVTKNWQTSKVDPILLRHILIQIMTKP
jgi:hypothetical protein